MSQLKVLPKRIDILDANSEDCRFRINIDVINECFGANRYHYMKACYPDKKGEHFSVSNSKNEAFVWMPKLYSNSSEWINTISDNGEYVYEVADNGKSTDKVNDYIFNENIYRLIFTKASPKDPYVFQGLYKNENIEHMKHTYKRVSCRVRLIGNPVNTIEILDSTIPTNPVAPNWVQEADQIDGYIDNLQLNGTEREAMVKVRINQGEFRKRMLKKYKTCCLCNISTPELLIASHIKPWSDCKGAERLNPDNGLLLCPNHDKLFDRGYISFDDNGFIIISEKLTNNDCKAMGLSIQRIVMNDQMSKFMAFHRQKFSLNN